MKQFLLIATYAGCEDYDLDVNTVNLGDFDSLDDCLKAAKQDYESIAEDYAGDYDEPGYQNRLNKYLANQRAMNPAEEMPEKWRVGSARVILHGWYYDFTGINDKTKYTVIKLS